MFSFHFFQAILKNNCTKMIKNKALNIKSISKTYLKILKISKNISGFYKIL